MEKLLIVLVAFISVAGILLLAQCGGWEGEVNEYPTAGEASTPLPRTMTRYLTCEEDEDIVISLDMRALPVAWCQQVVER